MNTVSKIIIAIIVIALIGTGAFVLTKKDDKAKNTSQEQIQPAETDNTVDSATTSESQSAQTSETESSTAPQSHEVEIEGFAFKPSTLTVKKGTTVKWTNKDSAEHNVFSDQDGGPKGSLLAKGESYSFTFTKTGTFSYICQPHPHMKGTITVTD